MLFCRFHSSVLYFWAFSFFYKILLFIRTKEVLWSSFVFLAFFGSHTRWIFYVILIFFNTYIGRLLCNFYALFFHYCSINWSYFLVIFFVKFFIWWGLTLSLVFLTPSIGLSEHLSLIFYQIFDFFFFTVPSPSKLSDNSRYTTATFHSLQIELWNIWIFVCALLLLHSLLIPFLYV